MATAPTPRNEIENKMRMGRLIDLSNAVLHQVLSTELQKEYPGFDPNTGGFLYQVINNQKAKNILLWLKTKTRVINESQMTLLYPSGNPSTTVTIHDLDITLTVVFLRNITSLNPKAKWDNPPVGDLSVEANIGRVKKLRNEHMHGPEGLSDATFQAKLMELKSLLLSMSTLYSSDDYDKLLTDPLHAKEAPCELLSTKLPVKNRNFKGRADLVKEIQEHIAGDSSLILLTGMGGIGKTSAAIEVGHQLKDVMYIDMRTISNLESVKLSIVAHYHPNQFLKDLYSDYQNIFTKTISGLATNTLLILDNNDSVLDTHKQEFLQLLQEIMTLTSQITLLCTSRESFDILSHNTFQAQIPPLDQKSSLEILWHKKATSPTESESAVLSEIAQRCGHNPLALKLLAIQLRSKQPKQILEKMESKPTLTTLQLPSSNIPTSEGMLACLDLSYETLSIEEQKVFRGLHIFQVAFTIEEVSNILDTENDECESILDTLMNKSLLSFDQKMYDLHPLVREYAEIQAQTKSEEMLMTKNRYCEYFTAYLSMLNIYPQSETASKLEKMKKMAPHLNITTNFLQNDLCNCTNQQSQKKILLSLAKIAKALNDIYLLQKSVSVYQLVAKEMRKNIHAGSLRLLRHISLMRTGHVRLTVAENIVYLALLSVNLYATFGELVRIHCRIGNVLRDMGEYKKALDYYMNLIGVCEKLLCAKHASTVALYNNIGVALKDMGKYKEALEYHKKCIAVREELLGEKHPDTAISYGNIGGVLREMGKYKEALGYYKKRLAVHEKLFGNKHRSTADTYNSIGVLLTEMGEYKDAFDYYKKCLAIREELLGGKHPETAVIYNSIGNLLRDMGEHKEALEYHKKCQAVREELLGDKHIDTAGSYNNIGLVLCDMGECKEALEYHNKCLTVREELLGEKHIDTAGSYNNIAGVLLNMGEYKEALEKYKKCNAVQEELLGDKHPHTAITYNNIGVALDYLGEYKEAVEYQKKCLAVQEELLGDTHPQTVVAYKNIMWALYHAGETDEALKYLAKLH